MKAASLVLVCALVATALGAPRTKRATLDPALSEHVRVAEQAWSAAEAEPDPAKQAALWERAAVAFAEVDADPLDVTFKREAARAALLAWKNALRAQVATRPTWTTATMAPPKPRELDARSKQVVAAIQRYARYTTDPKDPELPGALLLEARTYVQFDQFETANPIYRSIIDRFPTHEVAGYAAILLLDAYNRLGQHDKLVALANELAANKAFLVDREDLADTVQKIQRRAQRKRAEQLERDARNTKELETYVAAGSAYLDIYNATPDATDNDEVLYNAAVSFEQGGAMGSAIQAYMLLRKYFPNSRIAARGLARLAKLYGDIAMYDKAAEKLEEYAKKYAGEKDAYDAMSDAIYYRKALGDHAKAIENTKYFIRTWGSKKPVEAANAAWSLTALYAATPDQEVKHLRDYLRVHGPKGGAERVVIAHAMIGLALWKQSCSVRTTDGLCVKTERTPRVCGTGPTRVLTAVARDPRTTKQALAELAKAITLFERQGAPATDAAARYYYAQARLALADLETERFLAITFPTNLDLDRSRETSLKRFSVWFEDKQKLGATATQKYEAVLAIKDAASSITAAERLATIAQTFASTLVTSAVPRGVRDPDSTTAYCTAMTRAAEPLEHHALVGFGVCLAKSTELGWFGDSSAQCERELIRLKPEEFPPALEVRSAALHDALVIATEPPPR